MNATELPIGVLAGPQLEDAAEEAAQNKLIEQLLDEAIASKVRIAQPQRTMIREPEFAI